MKHVICKEFIQNAMTCHATKIQVKSAIYRLPR